jgi:hypothetical protein
MRNSYLPYNPVFESLSLQASKYTSSPRFSIYEAEENKLDAEETQKYVITVVLDNLLANVKAFSLSAPFASMSKEILPLLSEKSDTLSKNASIEDLVTSIYEIWEKCYALASAHKRKDMIMPYYNKVNTGMNSLMEAWKALKEAAGNQLSRPELLELVNSKMEENMKTFKEELAKIKSVLEKGDKK